MAGALPFLEFFAGGGLARLGLGRDWRCVWANDIDAHKAAAYRANFADAALHVGDVWAVPPADVPAAALAWASFPCQDLSLAGARGGLNAARSGAFFGFLRVIEGLSRLRRAPGLLVLENVSGALTSGGGRDLARMVQALTDQGYHVGALEIDAAAFLPQSRPRLFVIASAAPPPPAFAGAAGDSPFHTPAVRQAVARLPARLQAGWVWWRLAAPPARNAALIDLVEEGCGCWHAAEKTRALLAQMAPAHRARVAARQAAPGRSVGAVYRRIRVENGAKIQRAEVRFDGLAGCLRTPQGGSSRQFLIEAGDGQVRSRALTGREALRLMGAPEEYVAPKSQTQALRVAGDGVAVPVVAWLSARLLLPLAAAARGHAVAAE